MGNAGFVSSTVVSWQAALESSKSLSPLKPEGAWRLQQKSGLQVLSLTAPVTAESYVVVLEHMVVPSWPLFTSKHLGPSIDPKAPRCRNLVLRTVPHSRHHKGPIDNS